MSSWEKVFQSSLRHLFVTVSSNLRLRYLLVFIFSAGKTIVGTAEQAFWIIQRSEFFISMRSCVLISYCETVHSQFCYTHYQLNGKLTLRFGPADQTKTSSKRSVNSPFNCALEILLVAVQSHTQSEYGHNSVRRATATHSWWPKIDTFLYSLLWVALISLYTSAMCDMTNWLCYVSELWLSLA